MADICTAADDPCASGGHRTVTLPILGVPVTWRPCESELAAPFTDEERQLFASFLARARFQSGVPLAQFAGRVMRGDEATNVKAYTLFGPGVSITRTNIGSSYVNVLNEANGARSLIDFTGCSQFRVVLNGTLAQSGPYQVRIVRDGDDSVLYESPSVVAQAGNRELDTDWQSLPGWATDLTLVRVQARSNTATDDPVFNRCVVLTR